MVASTSEQATAAALIALGVFQAGLSAGAPWGRAAYGGARHGTLPNHLRAISGVAVPVYGTGAVVILRGSGSPRTRSRAFTALSVCMGLAAVANGASRSPIERTIWTPVTAAAAALAWHLRTART